MTTHKGVKFRGGKAEEIVRSLKQAEADRLEQKLCDCPDCERQGEIAKEAIRKAVQ